MNFPGTICATTSAITGACLAGRYELEGALGSGGMGAVFAARDNLLDRPVAIKLLPEDRRQNERVVQRLHREARAMARVAHPGVVQVFDHGVDPQLGPFIVMERLFGEDLAGWLHERAPLELSVALPLIEQICTAIHAAHGVGVIHRDLKPSNIFVMRGPALLEPRIKVLDFGVAKLDEPAQLTDPGDILGTFAYLPPERWDAGENADPRSDVYALGAIAYEMLSGFAPFRAATRAALRLAILHDEPRSLTVARPELPPSLVSAVSRALSKSPLDRFRSAWEFALALGVPFQPLEPALGQAAETFSGTARFRVLRALARGQNTELYAAWDLQRKRAVALKRLSTPHGESLSRLKREFRALSDVHHRNVVRAEELIEQGEHALLVLELVDGIPLLDYLRASPTELRASLQQLVFALAAIHSAGVVHGDLTPQNVLVEPGGRVVVLDCGLSSRGRDNAVPRGTRGYVAPEVLEGRLGPEADFFALGLIWCRAVTGELPPKEATGAALRDWMRLHARSAWQAESHEICARLLDPDPDRRASQVELMLALGIGADLAPGGVSTSQRSERFVGRDRALVELLDAFQRSAASEPTTLWLKGPSGIGKTTLLEHFGRSLERQGRALVLRTRARQSEAIPFPAFDELIEGLGEWLTRQAPSSVAALLPRETAQLARLFPALLRVPAVARAMPTAPSGHEAALMRLQATDALREMIRRICLRQPLVLLIDDVQWLDEDSADLLAAVLRAPEPPPLLLVGAMRTEQSELVPVIRRLESRLREPAHCVELEPLSVDETRELLRIRWRGGAPLADEAALQLARQSGGIPFFADLLAEGLAAAEASGPSALEATLQSRHERLPESSRVALELLCVASRPLRRATLINATGDDDRYLLGALVAGRFARAAHTGGNDALEPYHARIREAVLRSLSAAARRAHHLALARALRQERDAEPEALIEHLAASGEVKEAADVALGAAKSASEQLAFDRAAALFGVALKQGHFEPSDARAVHRLRAQSLQNAGRRRAAGHELLSAARLASTDEEREALRGEAGTHLLLSGDTRSGLEALASAISRAGLEMPETPADTVTFTLGALHALAARGVAVQPHDASVSGRALERIDLCLLLAQGLAHVDLRALPFAIRAFHEALDAGEKERLQRAAAVFVVSTAGHVPSPLTLPALELCRQLTSEVHSAYAHALLHAAEAEMALSQGKFLAAEANFERAERTLLESCVGATRELAVVRDMAVFIQYAHKGDFFTQLSRTQRWMKEADETEDQFHASMLRVAHAIVWVAHDQPARAAAELDRAEGEWPGAAGILSVVATLYRDIVDRYVGTDREARDERAVVLASPAAQTPFLAGYVALDAIWRAVRTLARSRAEVAGETPIARDELGALRGLGLDIWLGVADALEANIDYLRGARDRALHRLEEAEQTFRRLHMLCFAACARKRRGQFTGAELGARLQLEANIELQQLGVADVERWSRAYWSIFPVDAADLLTNVNASESESAVSGGS